MSRTKLKSTALTLLALLLFTHPVSAGCASNQDCCGGNNCECSLSLNQCNAAVSQSVPAQVAVAVRLPATPISFSALSGKSFTATPAEAAHYFYLASINNHPPTGPPLV